MCLRIKSSKSGVVNVRQFKYIHIVLTLPYILDGVCKVRPFDYIMLTLPYNSCVCSEYFSLLLVLQHAHVL